MATVIESQPEANLLAASLLLHSQFCPTTLWISYSKTPSILFSTVAQIYLRFFWFVVFFADKHPSFLHLFLLLQNYYIYQTNSCFQILCFASVCICNAFLSFYTILMYVVKSFFPHFSQFCVVEILCSRNISRM